VSAPEGESLEQRLARLTASAAKNMTAAKEAAARVARESAARAAAGDPAGTSTPARRQPTAGRRLGKAESQPQRVDRREPRFDVRSWSGALIVMVALAVVLFVVEAFDAAGNHRLDRFGLKPREVSGLVGVVASPFLHSGWWHLISNIVPFVLLGWVVLLSGLRNWLLVTAIVVVGGGLATWLVAPAGLIIGVSGVVFGWLGYLIARAFFARRLLWIAMALFVVFFFSSMFGGLLPSINSHVSWQAHVCGFAAGVLAGWLLHPRTPRRSLVAPSVS
jgi:membrane associated rhomboid family serine protease